VQLLNSVQSAAETLAHRYRSTLTADDHQQLALAFHRAESLAEYALEEALQQVPNDKSHELIEQIEDERRHINVFAHWLGAPPDIPRPKSKNRPPVVWYSILLANEIAGFCQFHMLAGLLEDTERRDAVNAIAADERVHIARLVRWLQEFKDTPTWGSVVQVTDAFRRRLGMRMQQFLPREELSNVRTEMAEIIDSMLAAALGLEVKE
jgi:hypothetical protein